MKLNLITFSLMVLYLMFETSCTTAISGDDFVLATRIDSLSYAHGLNYQSGANGLGAMGIELNADKYEEGFKNAQSSDPVWTRDLATAILSSFTQELQPRAGQPFTNDDPPRTNIDSLSLALGAYDSYTYQGCDYQVNVEAVCAGIKGAIAGNNQLPDDLYNKLNNAFNTELSAALQAEQQEKAEENLKIGGEFLAENKSKEGVQTTDSGLQYKVLQPGTGSAPSATETVVVHYEGRLIDGTVFDSSIRRGEPTEFPVNRVIPGWTEGLQLMKEGAKYQFYIPSELAYGPRGAGGDIGPNATLIFDVELLEVK